MKLKLTITTHLNDKLATNNDEAWKITDEIAYELRHLSILGKHLVFKRDGVHDFGFGNREHFIIFESNDDEDDE